MKLPKLWLKTISTMILRPDVITMIMKKAMNAVTEITDAVTVAVITDSRK